MIIRQTSKIHVYLAKIVLEALEILLDENLSNSGSLHVIFCIFLTASSEKMRKFVILLRIDEIWIWESVLVCAIFGSLHVTR